MLSIEGFLKYTMTRGRPRKIAAESALESAMNLYWRKGYDATSLQDLLDETKLCKSSLYQLFDSKQVLFLKSLDLYQSKLKQTLLHELAESSSGKQFIRDLFSKTIAEASSDEQKKGCMLANAANELSQSNQSVAMMVDIGVNNIKTVFIKAIERDIKSGALKTSVSTKIIAGVLLTNICGLRTMVKAGSNQQMLEEIVTTTLEILD